MIQRVRKEWSKTEVAGSTRRRLALLGRWTVQEAGERLTDPHFRRQGLDTAGYGARRGVELGPYEGTKWLMLPRLFPRGSIGTEDVLIDYGCGKGRVAIWVASHFVMRRVIGVEVDKDLHAVAQANWERWRGPRRCKTVEFVCEDAREFEVPDDVTIVYLANPFWGGVFDRVVEQLRASLVRRRRPLRVIYWLPLMHDHLVAAGFSVVRQRANRYWVSTESAQSGVERVPPWLPPYSLTIYQFTEAS